MGKFKFIDTPIKDLYVVEPTVFGDARGYFMETFNDEFSPYVKHLDNTPATFIQDNESRSKKGVLRGLHFQKANPQGKLVRVIEGEVFDVAVDLRRDSETFGKWYGVVLSAENKKQFYVPEGFAHGFYVMSESATFVYKCTRLYDPSSEGGLLWNDPDIDIKWPIDGEVLLSEKDKKNPLLKDLGFSF
ncbi:MAG: dTDP-4-dehydrorhamnose 3,5-epimerase [Clostridia bacterium]|nr:dTDP-4-dehydrorhamnose 3,5-epimerase [Clostridia bacterium]MBR2295939.1 dTDP-4-dehydrorhamnose 3,5-epimerase [Clostridia bacterium]